MSKQPEALRLAKWLGAMPSSGYALSNQAATELRRLHEVNQELLEALSAIRNSAYVPPALIGLIDAAIAKALGETK